METNSVYFETVYGNNYSRGNLHVSTLLPPNIIIWREMEKSLGAFRLTPRFLNMNLIFLLFSGNYRNSLPFLIFLPLTPDVYEFYWKSQSSSSVSTYSLLKESKLRVTTIGSLRYSRLPFISLSLLPIIRRSQDESWFILLFSSQNRFWITASLPFIRRKPPLLRFVITRPPLVIIINSRLKKERGNKTWDFHELLQNLMNEMYGRSWTFPWGEWRKAETTRCETCRKERTSMQKGISKATGGADDETWSDSGSPCLSFLTITFVVHLNAAIKNLIQIWFWHFWFADPDSISSWDDELMRKKERCSLVEFRFVPYWEIMDAGYSCTSCKEMMILNFERFVIWLSSLISKSAFPFQHHTHLRKKT